MLAKIEKKKKLSWHSKNSKGTKKPIQIQKKCTHMNIKDQDLHSVGIIVEGW